MKTDLHTVIEARRMKDGSFAYRAVTPNLGWHEAQAIWTELDDHRVLQMHHNYYMVRSANDPQWAWLTRPTPRKGFDGAKDATKDWGRSQGYEGREGGWIYSLSGRILGHGWGGIVALAKRTKGVRSTVHSTGRTAWYNSEPEFEFADDVTPKNPTESETQQ